VLFVILRWHYGLHPLWRPCRQTSVLFIKPGIKPMLSCLLLTFIEYDEKNDYENDTEDFNQKPFNAIAITIIAGRPGCFCFSIHHSST